MFRFFTALNISLFICISLVTIFGFIISYINLKFNILAVFFILIVSILFFLYFKKFYKMDYDIKLSNFYYISLIVICLLIYGNYSAIIEIRQDPAIYTYRSYLLINTGLDYISYNFSDTFWESFEVFNKGYGQILNGTALIDKSLELDFIPGPSYLMALFGLFTKESVFFSLSLIALSSALSTYILILRLTGLNLAAYFLTLSLFASPLFTWFGRAPYSEPIAYLATINLFLFLHNFFCDEIKKNNKVFYFIIFNSLFFFIYLIRIDSWFLIYFAIIFISMKDLKLSFLLIITTFLFQLAVSNHYSIYFNRINLGVFKSLLEYSHFFILCIVLLIQLIFRYEKIIMLLNKFFFQNNNIKKIFLIIGFIFIYFIIFRDEFTNSFEEKFMHGRVINTQNEYIFNNLSLIFPNLILILGFFGVILGFFNSKFKNNYFLIFVFSILSLFLSLFIDIKNSPQLYWGYRRFIPIIIPCFIVGICYFKFNSKFLNLFSIFVLCLSVFLQINSNQIFHKDYFFLSEMKNLDKSIKSNDQKLKTYINHPLFFDRSIQYPISSLISYFSFKPIPYKNINELTELSQKIKSPYLIALSQKNNNNLNCEYILNAKYNYVRLGENYNKIPKTIYYVNNSFFIYYCN